MGFRDAALNQKLAIAIAKKTCLRFVSSTQKTTHILLRVEPSYGMCMIKGASTGKSIDLDDVIPLDSPRPKSHAVFTQSSKIPCSSAPSTSQLAVVHGKVKDQVESRRSENSPQPDDSESLDATLDFDIQGHSKSRNPALDQPLSKKKK